MQKKSVKSPKAGFCGFFEVKIDESTFLDIDCGVYCCNKFSQIRFIEITVIWNVELVDDLLLPTHFLCQAVYCAVTNPFTTLFAEI